MQVLSGLQCSMQHEVGRELQALRLADDLLASVTSQFKRSPPRKSAAAGEAQALGGSSKAAAGATTSSSDGNSSGWTIAAGPAAGPPSYPQAPSPQQAVAVAADGALGQLQQLAGGERQLAQAAAALASASDGCCGAGGSGGGSLRSTFGQMHQVLGSVCQLLQTGVPQQQRTSETGGR
jgi:hypothetical protein